ncbi:MAG: hypothetical protein Q7J30_01180 [Candidatus Azambacteria bacterium]|nr:hypothetical protein [Candidatus Azambacteria bacterium]
METAKLKKLTIIIVQKYALNPLMANSGTKYTASQIRKIFMTIVKRPRVNSIKGPNKSFNTGLTKAFARARIRAIFIKVKGS